MFYAIVDSNNLGHRYYYSLNNLEDSKGRKTGVIFGLTKLLLRLLNYEKIEYLTFCFDYIPENPDPDGRHPVDFYDQMKAIIEMLDILRIDYVISDEEHIADEYIASIVNWMVSRVPQMKINIYSNDHDFWQLITENICCVKSGKMDAAEVVDLDYIKKQYNLEPPQLLDLWALTGDAGDKIPGVKGIGPVKGLELIQKYGDLLGALGDLVTRPKYTYSYIDAWSAYNDINLIDKNLGYFSKYPIVVSPIKESEYRWKKPLREFFERYDFVFLLKRLDEGRLIE